jgi:hypothetical protein
MSKEIEERYDVFVRASPAGTRLEFTGWTDEFPGLTAKGDKPDQTAAALGTTISLYLVANGATALPPPIDHDESALTLCRRRGEGYGRRMAIVRVQIQDRTIAS